MSRGRFPANKRPNIGLLRTFAAVAETSSFTQAAKQLGVSKGTVSRSVSQLEEQVKQELVHRTTHHVSLSTSGERFYDRIRQHLNALDDALDELETPQERPSGTLRLTAPSDIGLILLPKVLKGFTERYPEVRFEVHLTGQRVNLVQDGFDLALRVAPGQLDDSTLVCSTVAQMTSHWYATPNYLARHSAPTTVLDPKHQWILHHRVLQSAFPERPTPQFVLDDFVLARELALQGTGIALLPEFVADSADRKGHLERVHLSEARLSSGKLYMVYPSKGQTPRKVTAFREFLALTLNQKAQ